MSVRDDWWVDSRSLAKPAQVGRQMLDGEYFTQRTFPLRSPSTPLVRHCKPFPDKRSALALAWQGFLLKKGG